MVSNFIRFLVIWAQRYAKTIQSLVTTFAIITGGFWTYQEFVRERPNFPKLNIEHKTTSILLGNGLRYVILDINMKNVGKGKVVIENGFSRIQQVCPTKKSIINLIDSKNKRAKNELEKRNFPWTMIAKKDFVANLSIEQGQSFSISLGQFIPGYVRVARAYTYIDAPQLSDGVDRGWSTVSIEKFPIPKEAKHEVLYDDGHWVGCVQHD